MFSLPSGTSPSVNTGVNATKNESPSFHIFTCMRVPSQNARAKALPYLSVPVRSPLFSGVCFCSTVPETPVWYGSMNLRP